jgi:[ribosomal protein S5]-alanine N-acetyltransferase
MNAIFPSEFPRLETKNLILRETHLSDASAIFEIFNDDRVTQFHDLDTATRIEQVKFLIERRRDRFQKQEGIRWGIAKKQNDIIIGSCGYRMENNFRGALGYELASAYWRKGIMNEALEAIIDWGFERLQFNRIEAMVMLDNIASKKLLEKLAFREEGILREYNFWKGKFHDLRMFSLLKKDLKK